MRYLKNGRSRVINGKRVLLPGSSTRRPVIEWLQPVSGWPSDVHEISGKRLARRLVDV